MSSKSAEGSGSFQSKRKSRARGVLRCRAVMSFSNLATAAAETDAAEKGPPLAVVTTAQRLRYGFSYVAVNSHNQPAMTGD